MSTTDWHILEQAFERASQLGGDEREVFLRAFAKDHAQLSAKLVDLLQADAQHDAALESPIKAAADSLAQTHEDIWIGRTLGVWQIEKRIAAGGMGAVFLAHRADSAYTQHVALKIMMGQLLSPDAISRFRAERQILASLQHPNIASLIDGGSTDEQLPYLVMEFVDGHPIDEYCEAQQLDLRARLQLFQKVCDALDYAHRNLVVHRDIKPGNILVDTSGEPKLLDFGIAKLLDADSYDMTQALTRAESRALTLSYASPEHVRGQPVSIASDVYSLGVLLYRLLTGQSPYRETADSRQSIESAILETDPERPSAAVTREGGPTARSSARLQRLMIGDLDNIVLKALQKEPERRYATAAAFRDDIERYLTDRPVLARPSSLSYRLSKFIRRNTWPLLAATVFAATVIGLIVFYTGRLTVERDAAQLQAARSDEIANFLTGLFDQASPHRSKGQPVTAVELLENGFDRIESLALRPTVQADLMSNMASNMTALGQQQRAIPMLERAREILEQTPEADDLAISVVYNNLSEAYRQVGDYDKALDYRRQTLAIATELFGPDHENVAFLTMRVGVTLFDMRRVDEALDLEAQALAIFDRAGQRESSMAIDARGNYANALQYAGRLQDAVVAHRETVRLSEQVDGELAPNTLTRSSNLTGTLIRIGRLQEAQATIDSVLARAAKVWPAGHDEMAYFYYHQCRLEFRLGRFDKTIDACQQAVDVARAHAGEESFLYARRVRDLAWILGQLRQFDSATSHYERAVAATLASSGADSFDMRVVNMKRGQTALVAEDYDTAVSLLRDGLGQSDRLAANTRLLAGTSLATALSKSGQVAEATLMFEQLMIDAELLVGERDALWPLLGAATAHFRDIGELDRALRFGERVNRVVEQDGGPVSWRAAVALGEYGLALRAAGGEQADQILGVAREVLTKVFDADDPRVQRLTI